LSQQNNEIFVSFCAFSRAMFRAICVELRNSCDTDEWDLGKDWKKNVRKGSILSFRDGCFHHNANFWFAFPWNYGVFNSFRSSAVGFARPMTAWLHIHAAVTRWLPAKTRDAAHTPDTVRL